MKNKKPDFIKEIDSPLFNRLFYWYVLMLFRRRFRSVWLDGENIVGERRSILKFSPLVVSPLSRQITRESSQHVIQKSNLQTTPHVTHKSTLFIGHHNSWWDGLIPLLLNERVFRMRGRAMMDERQLRKYPFFRRIGTFSINRDHPRKALKSLDYALELLNESKSPVGLWLYPEGKLVGPETPIRLEGGLTLLARKLDTERCDIIPFATAMHTMRGDKPELYITIGEAIGPDVLKSDNVLDRIARIMEDLRRTCRERSADLPSPSG